MEQGSNGRAGAAVEGGLKPAEPEGRGRGAPVDPEVLERLRRSGIRIDRDGEFQHEGEPVRHEGLRQALFRWLDRGEDGRTILRLDERRFAHVDVDDTPLVARSARRDGELIYLGLSDGSQEVLDPTTLDLDAAGVMRCRVRGGRLEARLTSSAALIVADCVEGDPSRPVLRLGGRVFPLSRRA